MTATRGEQLALFSDTTAPVTKPAPRRRRPQRRTHDTETLCPDCRTELMPHTPLGSHDWQRYMVHDQVWADAGLEPHGGWFCIPCLETRLGRPLTGADFPADLPINDPDRDDDRRAMPRRRAT